MYIKRLRGRTLKETVNAIKAEFGTEPLILSARRIGPGVFEVIGAIDYDPEKKTSGRASLSGNGRAVLGPVVRVRASRQGEKPAKPRKS